MMKRSYLLMVACLAVTSAFGQRSLTVTGTAEVKAQPEKLVLSVGLSGSDESAPEALKKFQARVKLLEKSVAGLEQKDAKIIRGSTKFGMKGGGNNPFMMDMGDDGSGGAKAPTYEVSETVKIEISGIGQLDAAKRIAMASSIVDALGQAGVMARGSGATATDVAGGAVRVFAAGAAIALAEPASYGGSAASNDELVAFAAANDETLRQSALKLAVADAKSRAEFLAQLAGVKVGKVLSVVHNYPVRPLDTNAGECSASASVTVTYAIVD
jgi:uncharacterized protein YggE